MNRLLGAHVSIAGGLDKAIDRGAELGCTAIQTFASSPRTIKFAPIDEMAVRKYLIKREASPIQLHVFHGVYLINLAHVDPAYVKVCVESLIYYQQLAGKIGGLGTVFHVGSHKGKGLSLYLDQIAHALVTVLKETPEGIFLMLEMAAGQQGTIGQTVAELQTIFEAVDKTKGQMEKLAIGLDTQHAFASGYDLRTKEDIDRLIKEIDQAFGLDKVKVLHVNDSAVDVGSQRDRHANIGEGKLGKEGIAQVINHPHLKGLPLILEVPGDKEGPRKEDVDELKSLLS